MILPLLFISALLAMSSASVQHEEIRLTELFETGDLFPSAELTLANQEEFSSDIQFDFQNNNLEEAFYNTLTLRGFVQAIPAAGTPSVEEDQIHKAIYEAVAAHEDAESLILSAREEVFSHLLDAREAFIPASDALDGAVIETLEKKLTQAEQVLLAVGSYAQKQEIFSAIELLEQAEQYIFEAQALLEIQ